MLSSRLGSRTVSRGPGEREEIRWGEEDTPTLEKLYGWQCSGISDLGIEDIPLRFRILN